MRNLVNPMYLDLTMILGVNDLGSFNAKKHPIFRTTESLFGKLMMAPMSTPISKEIPELNIKLTGIILINQIQIQKDLKNAVSFFQGVVGFAMVLFCLNLLINLTRLTYSCYHNFCTPEIRQNWHIEQAREQLSLWAELAPLTSRNHGQNRVGTL